MGAPGSQLRPSPAAGSIACPRPGQALEAAGPVALVEQVVRHLLQVLQMCLHQHPSQVQEIAVMWVLHWGDGADPRVSGSFRCSPAGRVQSACSLAVCRPRTPPLTPRTSETRARPNVTSWVRLTWRRPGLPAGLNACPALLTLHCTPGVVASPHGSRPAVPHYLA